MVSSCLPGYMVSRFGASAVRISCQTNDTNAIMSYRNAKWGNHDTANLDPGTGGVY